MLFDGTSSFVNINDDDTLDATTFSIELWVKRTSANGARERFIMKKRIDGYADRYTHYALWFGNGLLAGEKQDEMVADCGNGTSYSRQPTGVIIDDTNWHHIVYTYDNSTKNWNTYKDGNFVKSGTHSVTGAPNNGPLILGKHVDAGANSNFYYNGTIDEFRFYNKILSANEVLINYNSSFTKKYSILNGEIKK